MAGRPIELQFDGADVHVRAGTFVSRRSVATSARNLSSSLNRSSCESCGSCEACCGVPGLGRLALFERRSFSAANRLNSCSKARFCCRSFSTDSCCLKQKRVNPPNHDDPRQNESVHKNETATAPMNRRFPFHFMLSGWHIQAARVVTAAFRNCKSFV